MMTHEKNHQAIERYFRKVYQKLFSQFSEPNIKSILFNDEGDTYSFATDKACMALGFQPEMKFGNVGFCGGRKNRNTWRKTLEVRMRTNNKLNPYMMPSPGIETGSHWWL